MSYDYNHLYVEIIGKVNGKTVKMAYYKRHVDNSYKCFREISYARNIYTRQVKDEKLLALEKQAEELYPNDFRLKFIVHGLEDGIGIDHYDLEYAKTLWPKLEIPEMKFMGNCFCLSKNTMEKHFYCSDFGGQLRINKVICKQLVYCVDHLGKTDLRRKPFNAFVRQYYDHKIANIPVIPYDPGEATFAQAEALDDFLKEHIQDENRTTIWRLEKFKFLDHEYVVFYPTDIEFDVFSILK